jgi:hypothetical protein
MLAKLMNLDGNFPPSPDEGQWHMRLSGASGLTLRSQNTPRSRTRMEKHGRGTRVDLDMCVPHERLNDNHSGFLLSWWNTFSSRGYAARGVLSQSMIGLHPDIVFSGIECTYAVYLLCWKAARTEDKLYQ